MEVDPEDMRNYDPNASLSGAPSVDDFWEASSNGEFLSTRPIVGPAYHCSSLIYALLFCCIYSAVARPLGARFGRRALRRDDPRRARPVLLRPARQARQARLRAINDTGLGKWCAGATARSSQVSVASAVDGDREFGVHGVVGVDGEGLCECGGAEAGRDDPCRWTRASG